MKAKALRFESTPVGKIFVEKGASCYDLERKACQSRLEWCRYIIHVTRDSTSICSALIVCLIFNFFSQHLAKTIKNNKQRNLEYRRLIVLTFKVFLHDCWKNVNATNWNKQERAKIDTDVAAVGFSDLVWKSYCVLHHDVVKVRQLMMTTIGLNHNLLKSISMMARSLYSQHWFSRFHSQP